jgi:hypothetical protein
MLLIQEVRAYLDQIEGFKNIKVVKAEKNNGLAASVIKGVSEIISLHKKVIVLEDDMLTTPDFLEYMNEGLRTYGFRKDIFSITAYKPPIAIPDSYTKDLFLAPRASSWGWGTWADKWILADWGVQDFSEPIKSGQMRDTLEKGGSDLWPMLIKQQRGVIDSWAIRWTLTQAINQAYGVYPVHSKIKNIGTDGTGTNFTFKTAEYGDEMKAGTVRMDPNLTPDELIIHQFRKYYDLPISVKIKNWIKFRI